MTVIPMESRKLFSNTETVIWCVCLALVGFGIIAAYSMATSKSGIDAGVKEAHLSESHETD